MAWIYLIAAGIFEVGFTTFLKLSANFSRLWPSIGFIVLALLSFSSLSMSLTTIPLGTAYAIWTGIGAFGTVVTGIIFFDESFSFWRIFFLTSLVISIIGLKFVSDVP